MDEVAVIVAAVVTIGGVSLVGTCMFISSILCLKPACRNASPPLLEACSCAVPVVICGEFVGSVGVCVCSCAVPVIICGENVDSVGVSACSCAVPVAKCGEFVGSVGGLAMSRVVVGML